MSRAKGEVVTRSGCIYVRVCCCVSCVDIGVWGGDRVPGGVPTSESDIEEKMPVGVSHRGWCGVCSRLMRVGVIGAACAFHNVVAGVYAVGSKVLIVVGANLCLYCSRASAALCLFVQVIVFCFFFFFSFHFRKAHALTVATELIAVEVGRGW